VLRLKRAMTNWLKRLRSVQTSWAARPMKLPRAASGRTHSTFSNDCANGRGPRRFGSALDLDTCS
jgi:hypothetical protein